MASNGRRTEIEAWWALIARILAFVFGTQVIAYDLVFMHGESGEFRLAVLFAGVAMLGPVIAASMAQIVQAARGGKHSE